MRHAALSNTRRIDVLVHTNVPRAPMHVELAPRRREAVTPSGRRGCAGRCGGQVRPGHGDDVIRVQVLEEKACIAGCHRRVAMCTLIAKVCTRVLSSQKVFVCKFDCIQERRGRRTGPAWNREQVLLHPLVGYDMALRPSAPQGGGLLLASEVLYYVHFNAMK